MDHEDYQQYGIFDVITLFYQGRDSYLRDSVIVHHQESLSQLESYIVKSIIKTDYQGGYLAYLPINFTSIIPLKFKKTGEYQTATWSAMNIFNTPKIGALVWVIDDMKTMECDPSLYREK